MSVADAYVRCEAITRHEAANFYYGIRLLARERRRAMCAAYAFARRIDDIGDGSLEHAQKLRLLDQAAAQLAQLEAAGDGALASNDPVLVALADAHRRFALPPGAMGELIDGVRMDVEGVSYERFEDLVLYCRRVAGAIGRVCLAIFDTRAPRTGGGAAGPGRAHVEALADDLGVALQLTNILRDVREDAEIGRVYLPAEDLRRFGLIGAAAQPRAVDLLAAIERDGGAPAPDGAGAATGEQPQALHALVRFEAERAQEWFDRGMALVPLLDRRSAACVSAMAGIYHRVLERVEADPARALNERMSLSKGEKLRVAVGSIAGRRA